MARRLESLQRELASSVSRLPAVNMNTHIATAYSHTVYTDIYTKAVRTHSHKHTYHLLSLGGKQRTEWSLCSVNFWPVSFEDLLSLLFIYFYPGRATYSLSWSLSLLPSLSLSVPPFSFICPHLLNLAWLLQRWVVLSTIKTLGITVLHTNYCLSLVLNC